MEQDKNIVVLLSSYDDEFMNVYFDENSTIIDNLKQKLIKVRKKIYEKIICEYENIKIYINPLNGDIHEIIKETPHDIKIDDKKMYVSYRSSEKKMDPNDIMILNNYPNQEKYVVNEYVVDENTVIVFLKNKENNLVKVYGKTTNDIDMLFNLLIK